MAKYVVNASVDEFDCGEVVEINPALFTDLIEGKFLSPIDDYGNRLSDDGEILVLHSSQYEDQLAAHGEEPVEAIEVEADDSVDVE